MHKEQISVKEGVLLLALYIMGNTLVLPTAVEAKQDLWISIIIGLVMVVPLVGIMLRLYQLFPNKDIFQILETIFGKIFGKLVSLLLIWYALSVGAAVLRNYGEFIVVSDLNETPKTVPMAFMLALCVWGVKQGQEVLGRWSVPFGIFAIGITFLTLILLISESRISNLYPIMYRGFAPVLRGGWSVYSFPLSGVFIFLMVFSSFEDKKPLKVYSLGVLLGWSVIFFTSLSEVSILGGELYARAYFPSNMAIARLDVANFLQRLEIIPGVVLLIGGFIKVSIVLLAVSRGMARVVGAKDYRFIVIPMALTMLNVSSWLTKTTFQMFEGMVIWPYYAIPFTIVLPIVIWVGAELFARRRKKQERCEA